jgi:pentatricopeptide repeat protein
MLIDCCFEAELYGKVLGFMGSMKELGFKPRLHSYQQLIVGFCEQGAFEEAKTAFCELIDLEINHDEVAWEVLIEGLLKRGQVPECCKSFVHRDI